MKYGLLFGLLWCEIHDRIPSRTPRPNRLYRRHPVSRRYQYQSAHGPPVGIAAARDWARPGNLYLQDGVWNGQRILPEEFVKFVSTLAPAWVADQRPIYGGLFWINGDGKLPIPKDAYYMSGAGGQSTIIIPSHDLVTVRLGHYKGDEAGSRDLKKSLALLMEAVQPHR